MTKALKRLLGVLCVASVLAPFSVTVAAAAEYLVTVAKPNRLFVVDMKARKVVRDHVIPGEGSGPQTVVPSPDGKIAYVLTNNWKTISGIELNTGKEVFRADSSHADDERTIVMGMTISPDGKKIYSHEVPAKILIDEYQPQPTRISIYNTNAGTAAKPAKILSNIPRRIALLLMSDDGTKLYAMGWDFYTMDPETGEITATFPLRNWNRPGITPPDMLNFWPMPESSGMFSSVMGYMRTDLPADDPKAYVTALLTLDLKSGQFDIVPINMDPEILFTATIAPNRRVAFGGFLGISKIDLLRGRVVQREELDHSFYQFNVSKSGNEVYVGGTMCTIAIYATHDLKKLGKVELPGCPDVGGGAMRLVNTTLD